MSKKNVIIIVSLIVVLAGVLVGVYFKNRDNSNENEETVSQSIKLGRDENDLFPNDALVIDSYDEYKKIFKDNDSLKEDDFKKQNYVALKIKYNSCSERNLKIKDYDIKDDKMNVKVEYERACGFCAPDYLYYAIAIDKDIKRLDVTYDFKKTNNPDCEPLVEDKPMIYLYPTETTKIIVKLGNPTLLRTTYPKYKDSWNVTATKDGILTDNNTGRKLYGLYWEGIDHHATVKEDGFVVKGSEVISFLEEKLSILGLNELEINEFIVYWLPKLEHNEYNYIRFETLDEINSYMPLEVNPKPDNIIRISMDYKPLIDKIEVKEQILSSPNREGFTVVEWGGSLIE